MCANYSNLTKMGLQLNVLDKIPPIILVGLGGVIGSITRYGIGQMINSAKFPLATLVVNLCGSILLGIIVTLYQSNQLSHDWMAFLGIGLMGSLTTMSSFAVDTINTGDTTISILNIVITLVGVLVGAIAGKTLALKYLIV